MYVYWPRMQEYVAWFIRGCIPYHTSKPNNRKHGLYHPSLPIPTKPWDNIPMDFVCSIPRTKKGHGYLFLVVGKFSKICIFMACSKTIKGQKEAKLFLKWSRFTLGYQEASSHIDIPVFLVPFGLHFGIVWTLS